jgi:hypothetical protein
MADKQKRPVDVAGKVIHAHCPGSFKAARGWWNPPNFSAYAALRAAISPKV